MTAMQTTRAFKSGNSQAVRIPAELAYADTAGDLQITRMGDVITIAPKRGNLKDDIALLRAMPKPPAMDRGEPIDLPHRAWD
jgi:antitoxin VapB